MCFVMTWQSYQKAGFMPPDDMAPDNWDRDVGLEVDAWVTNQVRQQQEAVP